MTTAPAIRTLSEALVRENLAALISVAADIPGEYWAAENFLSDRPGKWQLSFGLWRDGAVIGYAILSERSASHIHLHHFMVTAAERSHGHGERMVSEMFSRCRNAGATILTLKTPVENTGAKRFYARYGFQETGVESNHTVMTVAL